MMKKITNIITLPKSSKSFSVIESINTLRSNVEFSGRHIKRIAVTSSQSNEGKSFITYQLANSFASLKKKTILIDCDIRKSILHNRLNVRYKFDGLSAYLSENASLQDVIQKTSNEYFDIIFAGRTVPNPTNLLADISFGDMIKILEKEYDYILFDTPPLGVVIDAAIISKVCDGTIIVLETGNAEKDDVLYVKNQLLTAGSNILGVVMNKVGGNQDGYHSYYNRKNYGYYRAKYKHEVD